LSNYHCIFVLLGWNQ